MAIIDLDPTVQQDQIIAFGDSITKGSGASAEDKIWTRVAQDLVRDYYGIDGGDAYRPAVLSEFTETGTLTQNGYGYGRWGLNLDVPADSVTFPVNGTTARVFTPDFSSSGILLAEVDSPAARTNGYSGTVPTDNFWYLSSCTNINTLGAAAVVDLIFWAEANDWTPAVSTQSLGGWSNICRADLLGTGSGAAGKLNMTLWSGGTARSAQTTAVTGFTDGTGRWLKFSFDNSTNNVTFSQSTDPYTTARASITWSTISVNALSAAIATVDSMATAIVGANNPLTAGGEWQGKIRYAEGIIAGTSAWLADFRSMPNNTFFFENVPNGARWNVALKNTGGTPITNGLKVTNPDAGGQIIYDGFFGTDSVASAGSTYTDVALGSSGAHNLKISYWSLGAGAFGEPTVEGVQQFDGDETTGFQIIKAGHGGYKASNFAGAADSQTQITRQVSRTPNLRGCIINFGTNEYSAQDTAASFDTAMRALVDAIRAGNATMPIIFVKSWQAAGVVGPTIPWSAYCAVIDDIADDYLYTDVVDVSPTSDFPQPVNPDVPGDFYADTVHPSDDGHAAFGEIMADAILGLGSIELGLPIQTLIYRQLQNLYGEGTLNDLLAEHFENEIGIRQSFWRGSTPYATLIGGRNLEQYERDYWETV